MWRGEGCAGLLSAGGSVVGWGGSPQCDRGLQTSQESSCGRKVHQAVDWVLAWRQGVKDSA